MSNEFYDYGGDPEAEQRWDAWSALPDLPSPGDSVPFDRWLESKGLLREDLVRVGARWGVYAGRPALVYLFPDGLKYRTLDKRIASSKDGVTYGGVEWKRSKIIKSQTGDATELIIAEGETDAALLSRLAPGCDVCCLPAGAKFIPAGDDFSSYERIYVGLDADASGDEGAEAWMEAWSQSVRMRPRGATDWCELGAIPGALFRDGEPFNPEDWVVEPVREVYTIAEIAAADFGDYEDNNWFSNGIMPVAGEVAIHGPIKSLKSVVATELARAAATATPFADYVDYIYDRPARVLIIQFEIPPHGFQQRVWGMQKEMGEDQWELFSQNVAVVGIGNNKRPRMKVNEPNFRARIMRDVELHTADIVIFDPVQRMVGSASLDKTNELEPLLDTFDVLMQNGITVVYCHHDNKAERNKGTPYSMAGSQRFGADADSICSLYHDRVNMYDDHNPEGIKQRNLAWELRSGVCQGRSVTARPDDFDPNFMHVTWDLPITTQPDSEAAPESKLPRID